MSGERWLSVPGHPDYEVSDRGRIRSYKRGANGRILVQRASPKGYMILDLDGKTVAAHRIMMTAFVGPRPSGLLCRHLDGDPGNNTLSNVVYGTAAENMQDRIRHGRNPFLNRTKCKNGHEFDEANTYRHGNRRMCRACNLDRHLRYYSPKSRGVAV